MKAAEGKAGGCRRRAVHAPARPAHRQQPVAPGAVPPGHPPAGVPVRRRLPVARPPAAGGGAPRPRQEALQGAPWRAAAAVGVSARRPPRARPLRPAPRPRRGQALAPAAGGVCRALARAISAPPLTPSRCRSPGMAPAGARRARSPPGNARPGRAAAPWARARSLWVPAARLHPGQPGSRVRQAPQPGAEPPALAPRPPPRVPGHRAARPAAGAGKAQPALPEHRPVRAPRRRIPRSAAQVRARPPGWPAPRRRPG